MIRQARQLGAGAEIGIRESGPGVQSAAADGLVPAMPAGPRGSGGGGGGTGPREVHLHLAFNGPVYGSRSALETMMRDVFDDRLQEIVIAIRGAEA